MITIYRKDGTPLRVPQSMMDELMKSGNYSTYLKKEEASSEKTESNAKKRSYNYQKKEETGTE